MQRGDDRDEVSMQPKKQKKTAENFEKIFFVAAGGGRWGRHNEINETKEYNEIFGEKYEGECVTPTDYTIVGKKLQNDISSRKQNKSPSCFTSDFEYFKNMSLDLISGVKFQIK